MPARPATTDDLDRLEQRLRGDMAELATKADLAEMKAELIKHIADASVHTANVIVEWMREELARHRAASAAETRKLIAQMDDR